MGWSFVHAGDNGRFLVMCSEKINPFHYITYFIYMYESLFSNSRNVSENLLGFWLDCFLCMKTFEATLNWIK